MAIMNKPWAKAAGEVAKSMVGAGAGTTEAQKRRGRSTMRSANAIARMITKLMAKRKKRKLSKSQEKMLRQLLQQQKAGVKVTKAEGKRMKTRMPSPRTRKRATYKSANF